MTHKIRILQKAPLPLRELNQELAQRYDVAVLSEQPDPAAFLAEQGKTFEGFVTSAAMGGDAGLLAALPNLRVISSFGVGYDKLDVAGALQRGVAVGNTPDVLNDCVADQAFALLMDVARQLSTADRFVRAGRWPQDRFPMTTRVSGKRLGILGLGRIGHAVARRASGFDMQIAYHNRRPLPDVPYEWLASPAALAAWADFLVVTVPGGEGNNRLVDRSVLDALGPKGFLINVARGSVVDEPALVEALVERRIAGAGLDVFADEPRVPSPLLALDNVVLQPHVASGTHETRRAMADLVLANLEAFFNEGRVRTPVVSA